MIYVIMSTICMSMLILSLKIANYRGVNGNHVAFWNYVIAFGICFVISLSGGSFFVFSELGSLDIGSLFTTQTLAGTAFILLVTGFISGISFPSNLVIMKNSIAGNGSAITSFFKQMSTLGGLLVAIIFMGERPGAVQWVGIGLMTAAITLMVCDFKSLKIENAAALVFIFISGTFMEVGNKVISKYTVPGYSTLYLAVVFGVALIFMTVFLAVTEGKNFRFTGGKELFYGALLGMSNIGNNFFKIKALTVLPAAVVIPCVAAGALIITNLVSIFVFKEKANRLYGVAVAVAIISIFLLNA